MKKQMKKFTALCMAALMVVLLSACGAKDPKAAYQAAIEKNGALNDTDMKMTMDMNMEMDEEKMAIKADIDMKVKNADKDGMQMEMNMDMDMNGQTMNMTAYYLEGYYYMELLGQKIKYAMDLDELKKQTEGNSDIMEMGVDCFSELSMKTEGDNQVFTFTGDEEKMDKYISAIMDQMTSTLKEAAGEDIETKFNDISGTLTVDKAGYVSAQTMKIDTDMTAAGETVKAIVNVDSTINNPGQEVTIEFPDFADYQEMEQ